MAKSTPDDQKFCNALSDQARITLTVSFFIHAKGAYLRVRTSSGSSLQCMFCTDPLNPQCEAVRDVVSTVRRVTGECGVTSGIAMTQAGAAPVVT